jgi:glucokinase
LSSLTQKIFCEWPPPCIFRAYFQKYKLKRARACGKIEAENEKELALMTEYIGVDIGGTKIAVVKGDENGNILKKIRFENSGSKTECISRILSAIAEMGAADAVGISCGGPLDSKRGIVLSPPNLPGWDEVPIVDIIANAAGIPAFLQNDADACALAEWRFGAGKGTENMVFLTFGTGMGAGLILGGALYSGTCGMAGEIGHMAMEKSGPVGYGKAGSFEGFCSGGGIARTARAKAEQMLAKGKAPSYCESISALPSVTAQSVAECARKGHADALEIYENCGYMLGRGLAVIIDMLNPKKIVIGSVFARAEDLLAPAMYRALEKEALPASLSACEIVPAGLSENIGDIAALCVAVNGIKRRN